MPALGRYAVVLPLPAPGAVNVRLLEDWTALPALSVLRFDGDVYEVQLALKVLRGYTDSALASIERDLNERAKGNDDRPI